MGLVKKAPWLTACLFLTFLFLERCHALPPYSPGGGFQQEPEVVKPPPVERPPVPPKTLRKGQDPIGDGKVYSQTKSITIRCLDAWLEIVINADLYNTGVLIDGDDLRLGEETTPACRAKPSAAAEYSIVAALSDCGTRHLIANDSLIYTNLLIYSPVPSTDGIIRMEGAFIPIECHYRRRYGLSSGILKPTWIPFTSTQSAGDALDFSLRLMNSDWLSEKTSDVYFLGDIIYIEASVTLAYHMPLRMFVDSCVATVFPDKNSVPRYSFIENGCLTDARQTGSSSHFLPRAQDDKLHIYLEAFRFRQETRSALYIACHLKAVPVMHNADSKNRACSFINGSWRSVDGNDWICDNCETPNIWEQPIQSGHHELEKELLLQPLKVFPSEHGGMAPRLKQTESRPLEAKALWASDDDEEAQEGQTMTPASEEGINPVDYPGEHNGSWPVEFSEMDAKKELEMETTPGPRAPPAKQESDPVDPVYKEDGSHLEDPLAKEEAGAFIDEDEGSGIMVYEGRKDGNNETTLSPVAQDSGNPEIFSDEEPVGSAVLPSKDANATVVPSYEESNTTVPTSEDKFSPAVLTREEDAHPVDPPDQQTMSTELPLSWEEEFRSMSLSDDKDTSLIQ
ncbi:uncharacterized protein LOC118236126 isoform X1 [Anguilla anguilla]|uniref:uncharacterized protein LOC118236126 isoform X1 n=1 Tax=Anguilla anguilla TaxID=7936 RepID=UPI0015AC6D22|nr:uncharacterized protein LOC118236126 isoform X1 [Anguilla anguilla]